MIDFACKQIELSDLIQCSFQLTKTEYKILVHLIEKDKKEDVKSLAEELKLDRSTVQKAIKKLYQKELIKRNQMNIRSGGYLYVYKAKDKEKIKDEILDLIENWSTSAKESIKKW
mgnify:CR=1 FL=1